MKISKRLFTDSLFPGYTLITPRKKKENRKRGRVVPPLENDVFYILRVKLTT